jgi:signal peptidase I
MGKSCRKFSRAVFPHDPAYPWNEDNFGPLVIPAKGVTISINTGNISIYQRVIEAYELTSLEIRRRSIILTGKEQNLYL